LACFPLSDALTLATSSLNTLLAKCVNLVWSNFLLRQAQVQLSYCVTMFLLKVAVINVGING